MILYNGGVCVRHGAKVKQYNVEGCTNGVINKEEDVLDMEQRSNDAALKDAQMPSCSVGQQRYG